MRERGKESKKAFCVYKTFVLLLSLLGCLPCFLHSLLVCICLCSVIKAFSLMYSQAKCCIYCIHNVWIVFQHGELQEEENQSLSDNLNNRLSFGFCLNWP